MGKEGKDESAAGVSAIFPGANCFLKKKAREVGAKEKAPAKHPDVFRHIPEPEVGSKQQGIRSLST